MAKADGRKESNYHSPLRTSRAAETRRLIIDAALALFGEQGWAATSLPSIARRAGVSVDTIYATFGTKSALLMAVVEVAIVGDDLEQPMAERDDFAQLGQGRRAERLRTGIRYTMGVYSRSLPILQTLQEAAGSDEAARARLDQYDDDRRTLVGVGVALMLGREPSDDLVDAAWALVSPEVYRYLVVVRGWSTERTEDWFVEMLKAAITTAT